MTRFSFLPALAGLFLATSALAGAKDMIREITVEMDLAAVTNPAAAKHFATTADDLKNAIAARLADRTAEEGWEIHVDLNEIELSNTYSEQTGSADTRLVGQVRVNNEKGSPMGVYETTVDVNQAKLFYPEGVDMATVASSSDVYYKALIAAFADSVVRNFDR